MSEKESTQNIIQTYRNRQKWSKILPFVFFAVVVLVVFGAGLFFNSLRDRGMPSPPIMATETPAPNEALELDPSPTNTLDLPPTEITEPLMDETPTPEESATESGIGVYVVKEGDTLDSISRQLNLSLQEILSLNPTIDPDLIVVGQEIVIPSQGALRITPTPLPADFQGMLEYQVVAGDTLVGIAERYGTTVQAIVQANGLENADDIRIGDVLRIPVGTATPPGPPTASPTVTP